jgi:hypothetical protein
MIRIWINRGTKTVSNRAHAFLIAIFVLCLSVLPALAHHSFTAEFNPDKEFTVTGVLTKVDWVNPHIATWIDVKDEKTGQVESWGCQGNPPGTYSRAGVHRDDWRIGELVTVTCLAPKDGSKKWGFLKQIKYHSDGHVLVFRQGGE